MQSEMHEEVYVSISSKSSKREVRQCHERVRGEALLSCKSCTSKNVPTPNETQSKQAAADETLYALHLEHYGYRSYR
jgi:hypothetical protein